MDRNQAWEEIRRCQRALRRPLDCDDPSGVQAKMSFLVEDFGWPEEGSDHENR